MWMPAQTTRPAGAHRRQGRRHQRADRREEYRRIQRFRGRLVGVAGPDGAQLAGEGLRLAIPGLGEREHPPALRSGDLRQQVRGGPEAVEAEIRACCPRRGRRDSRSGRRRGAARAARPVHRRAAGRQKRASASDLLRVAAIHRIAGEACALAEVLLPGPAVAAAARRPAASQGTPTRSPGRKRVTEAPAAATRPTISCPGVIGVVDVRQLPVEKMQVRAADAAGLHADAHLVLAEGRQ